MLGIGHDSKTQGNSLTYYLEATSPRRDAATSICSGAQGQNIPPALHFKF